MIAILVFIPLAARAQGSAPEPSRASDSVRVRDTLVESTFRLEHKPLRAGIEAEFGWNDYYDASFPTPWAEPGCDEFSMGTGNGYGLRLLAEMPLWGDESPWAFRPSLFLEYQHPQFNWTEFGETFDPLKHTLDSFDIRHEILTTIGEAGISGAFDYEFLPRWHANAGVNLGILIDESYQTSLNRTEPGSLLADRSSTDTITGTGTLPTKKFTFLPSLSFGLGYDAPLSKKLWAEPGVNIALPFGGQVNDGTAEWRFAGTAYWREVQFNATLALLFDLTPRTETVPVYIKREILEAIPAVPPSEPKPSISASIRALAISSNGAESPVLNMRVEEVRTRNADPILNYIFFDAGSSDIPARYVHYPNAESAEQNFRGSSDRAEVKLMELYREALNILGDRMKKFPHTRVTLVGTTDNMDDRTALGARSDAALVGLARARAETVKQYLVTVWKIDPMRLPIEATLLPQKASPSTNEDGRAENRRVEFRVDGNDSSAFGLLAPVTVTNTEHLATPDRIDLQPSVHTEHGIARSYAAISARGTVLESFRNDSAGSGHETVWAPTEEMLQQLRDSLEIDYDVWDSIGNHAHAHSTIPLSIVHIASDRPERIERFSLILFGFDEANLTPRNDRLLQSAAQTIKSIPIQQILIQGFTDEMGDPAHNDALSQTRATHVRDALEQALADEGRDPATLQIFTQGLGSRELPYDNSLPEGRFFSRTVNITIQRQP